MVSARSKVSLRVVRALGVTLLGLMAGWGAADGQPQHPGEPGAEASGHDDRSLRDRILADAVFLRLAESPVLNAAKIRVTAGGGTVTLSGSVPSEPARTRAVRITRRLPGVNQVRDRLHVDPTPSRVPPVQVGDAELAQQVARRLARETFPGAAAKPDPTFGWEVESQGAWEFDVEVERGTVTLSGGVPIPSDVVAAVRAAREVPGVRNVLSRLYVSRAPYGFPFPGSAASYAGYPFSTYGPVSPDHAARTDADRCR